MQYCDILWWHIEAVSTSSANITFQKRMNLEAETTRRTSALTWVGLGLMGVQFGVLARLTWWEYSWDIMEPVTYFVTYGTAMAVYAYFVLTKQVSYFLFFKNIVFKH